jgi:hypothetical protein
MNRFLEHYYEFTKKNFIDKYELKRILLSGEEFRLYGVKLDGTPLIRDFVKTIDGPSMGVGYRYWDSPYNYLILWSLDNSDWRTIVLKNVKKIRMKSDNKLLYVR